MTHQTVSLEKYCKLFPATLTGKILCKFIVNRAAQLTINLQSILPIERKCFQAQVFQTQVLRQ